MSGPTLDFHTVPSEARGPAATGALSNMKMTMNREQQQQQQRETERHCTNFLTAASVMYLAWVLEAPKQSPAKVPYTTRAEEDHVNSVTQQPDVLQLAARS